MKKNKNFVYLIIFVVVAIIAYILYFIFKPSSQCIGSEGSTCSLNSDCNFPNGSCYKNSNNICSCNCADGYSGDHCEIQGIPWNSPQCLGPNTGIFTPRKSSTGLCICPEGNWQGGNTDEYGYVQCLKCADGWGPLDLPNQCQSHWQTVDISTQNCYGPNFTQDACEEEYSEYKNQQGPNNEQSNVTATGNCTNTESCHCISPTSGATQKQCKITSWINPSVTFPKCIEQERPCSDYKCNMSINTSNWDQIKGPNSPLIEIAINNLGQMCGISDLSSNNIWCTSNYKATTPTWTQISIPTGLTNISLSDKNQICGAGDENNIYCATYNPQIRNPIWSTPYITNHGTVTSVSEASNNDICAISATTPIHAWCHASSGSMRNNNPFDSPITKITTNNNQTDCFIVGGTNQIACNNNDWFDSMKVTLPNNVSLNDITLNDKGKLCGITTTNELICTTNYKNWIPIKNSKLVNLKSNNNDLCGIQNDNTIACTKI